MEKMLVKCGVCGCMKSDTIEMVCYICRRDRARDIRMRSEAKALPPGPELDALVSVKVMGWKWDERRCRVCGWSLSADRLSGCRPDDCSQRPAPETRADSHFPYSTDTAAAWDLRLKLILDGWWVSIVGILPNGDTEVEVSKGDIRLSARAERFSHAMALVSLKAMA